MSNFIGQSFGRYHILEQLGQGGMATVFKAYDTRLESEVAVKVIRTENLAPSILERALKRFEREAKALAKLTHPNIVKVLDYGEFKGKPYLVMPYLPGGTLKEKIHGNLIPHQDAAKLLIPIARALAYAHSQEVVHRDVKPSNILITESGDPMLTDFGIAKIIDDEVTMDLTGTSAAVGTPEYMAPEQVTSKNVDHRADIYALGIVFYEMVTGRKPFQADTPMAVLFKHASEPLPRPKSFVADLPDEIERILLKALAKKPEDRYQSMIEFANALERGNTQSAKQKKVPTERKKNSSQPIVTSKKVAIPKVNRVILVGLPVIITAAGIIAILQGNFLNKASASKSESNTQAVTPTQATSASEVSTTDNTITPEPTSILPTPPIQASTSLRSNDPKSYTHVTTGDIDTLDPALAYDTASGEIIQNVYETLVFYDGIATDKFVPQLADSWDISEDGTVWTFHIRQGVKFHNGDILTATDVAYSFQRGLLQGGYISPQWLLAEPFFGVGQDDISILVDGGASADDRQAMKTASPSALRAACEKTKFAIVADDTAGTVTFTLAQAWGPFLPTLAQPWGSILDKNWVIDNGGWDGSCDTWQNYYAMVSADDPLTSITNGTGPFKLDHRTPGQEIMLVRNDDYWRAPAKLETISILIDSEWDHSFAMLQNGTADSVDVPVANRSQVDELIGENCIYDELTNTYKACDVADDSNPLRLYKGYPNLLQDVILFKFDINSDGKSYIGSRFLDGNGIPPDFFSDVHIRRAFAYCFDWNSLIDNLYNGEAVQSTQLMLPGMPGYDVNAPHYTYSLANCEEEFKLADVDNDGIQAVDDNNDVWTRGFYFQLPYNEGNATRQNIAEILSSNLKNVNDKFRVESVALPWPSYLESQRAGQLPIMTAGWLEDIHDPHNWFYTYTFGVYSIRQSLPDNIKVQYKTFLDRGVTEINPEKRSEIYKQLANLYYEQATGIPLVLAKSYSYEQRWVYGRINNPIFLGSYFYSIYKQ